MSDDLDAARGCLNAVIPSLLLWAIIITGIWIWL